MKPETNELLMWFKSTCHGLDNDSLIYYARQIDFAPGNIIAAAQKIIEAELIAKRQTGKFANLTTIKCAIAQAQREVAAARADGQAGCERCEYRGLLPILCTYDANRRRYDWQVVHGNAAEGGSPKPAVICENVVRCRCGHSPNVQIPIVSAEQLAGYERLYEPYLKVGTGAGSHSRAWTMACRTMLAEGGFADSRVALRLDRIAAYGQWEAAGKAFAAELHGKLSLHHEEETARQESLKSKLKPKEPAKEEA